MAGIVDCTGVVAVVVVRSQMGNTWNMHLPLQNKRFENKFRESTEIATRKKL